MSDPRAGARCATGWPLPGFHRGHAPGPWTGTAAVDPRRQGHCARRRRHSMWGSSCSWTWDSSRSRRAAPLRGRQRRPSACPRARRRPEQRSLHRGARLASGYCQATPGAQETGGLRPGPRTCPGRHRSSCCSPRDRPGKATPAPTPSRRRRQQRRTTAFAPAPLPCVLHLSYDPIILFFQYCNLTISTLREPEFRDSLAMVSPLPEGAYTIAVFPSYGRVARNCWRSLGSW